MLTKYITKTDQEVLDEFRAAQTKRPKKPALERDIEGAVTYIAQEHGWLVRKFSSPQRRSVPDRIFIRQGVVLFIEFKQPGKGPTKAQEREIQKLQEHGALVFVCDNVEDGKRILGIYG